MTEDATAPDLYSYGRALDGSPGLAPHEPVAADVCIGCGASVTSTDPDLVRHLGWRLLPRIRDTDPDHPALCPRCAPRHHSLLR